MGCGTIEGIRVASKSCGTKETGRDLAIWVADGPCQAAGGFTQTSMPSYAVTSNRRKIAGDVQAILVSAGVANVFTGAEGEQDADEIVAHAADELGIPQESVLFFTTGFIGSRLPVDAIKASLSGIADELADDDEQAARAIMTTDTVSKTVQVKVSTSVGDVTIGATAKGSGMVNPNMATLLCFVSTDAAISHDVLQPMLKRCVDRSLNMVAIDNDTAFSDSCVMLATGAVKVRERDHEAVESGLLDCLTQVARLIAMDGEGSTRMFEVQVTGGLTEEDARKVAKSIASSMLVKTAVFGEDPNVGRVLCAASYAGAKLDEKRLAVSVVHDDLQIPMVKDGVVLSYDRRKAAAVMKSDCPVFVLELGMGEGAATAFGCDLTDQYVSINADFPT